MGRSRFHEEWAIVATVDPVDANNTDGSSDIIDMSKYDELVVVVQLGVLNASTSSTVKLQSDSDSAFGSGTDISGKTLTYDGDDDGFQYVMTLIPEELTAGERYVRVIQDTSAHSQLAAVLVLGRCKYQPATDHDLSSVQTVVD